MFSSFFLADFVFEERVFNKKAYFQGNALLFIQW
jgi:hypothetical protein